VGGLAGWFARDAQPPADLTVDTARPDGRAAPAALTRAAAVAHAAFAPEVRHPVEVGAGEQAHLVAWLSKRLGASLKVPDLEPEGFRLMGGRLLPDEDGGVAAQFMFENAGGQRLTLFVRRDAAGTDTAFRYVAQGSLGTFFWLDHGFGYALSGELPREAMLSVATSVYRQLNP
jgi:anti-sigma factor RsiW